MDLNDLLAKTDYKPENVLVLRHRPHEPELNKVLPWIAAERPDLFNAYQQTQSRGLEAAMEKLVGRGNVVSCIRSTAGEALFIGMYSIESAKKVTYAEYWEIDAYRELEAYGMRGFTKDDGRKSILFFDLKPCEFYNDWKGKLKIAWPPPDRSWWRRAHKNDMAVVSVAEEGLLDEAMPSWDELNVTWEELSILPGRWKSAIAEWRGIYFIFDASDGKGYVGSAYGKQNILGRWLNYAAKGDGGNKLLRKRDPVNFRFSILQRVSPDMDSKEVIQLESNWKSRLHTRSPNGLNAN